VDVNKKIFKGILILLFFSPLSFVNANTSSVFKPGFYLDAELGVSDADYQSIVLMGAYQPGSVDQVGLAPRFALGYDFIRYVGMELGVIYFDRPRLNDYSPTGVSRSIKHNLVQLVAKISLPLASWDLSTRLGIGYVVRGNVTNRVNDGTGNSSADYMTALKGGQFICPVYGLSVDRRFSQHWSIELVWLQSPAESIHQLPVANFYGVGTAYKF
jgi:hypothetical protein